MSTNGAWVFEKAINLMDEAEDTSGLADIFATRDFKLRTVHLLNVLIQELFPLSDTWPGEGGKNKRPVAPPVESLEDNLPLDDGLSRGVLPYGLAAALLAEENPLSAAYFQLRYERLMESFRKNLPASFTEIEDVYGGI